MIVLACSLSIGLQQSCLSVTLFRPIADVESIRNLFLLMLLLLDVLVNWAFVLGQESRIVFLAPLDAHWRVEHVMVNRVCYCLVVPNRLVKSCDHQVLAGVILKEIRDFVDVILAMATVLHIREGAQCRWNLLLNLLDWISQIGRRWNRRRQASWELDRHVVEDGRLDHLGRSVILHLLRWQLITPIATILI